MAHPIHRPPPNTNKIEKIAKQWCGNKNQKVQQTMSKDIKLKTKINLKNR
ncbi:unnamed protein product [marine sediment metagenome]|uniref:Uncharacterized protein n=1 Tax=marine sediment metagenome TaxID=412755 RepID=X1UZC2_9ZZZZ